MIQTELDQPLAPARRRGWRRLAHNRLALVLVAALAGALVATPIIAFAAVSNNDRGVTSHTGRSLAADGNWQTPFAMADTITSASTAQTGRVFRNGAPSGSCASAYTYPGTFDTAARRVNLYQFVNHSAQAECANVTYNSTYASGVFSVAYLTSFNAADPSVNYLADAGSSTAGGSLSYSFMVPAGATFIIAMDNVDANASPTAPMQLQVTLSGSPFTVIAKSTSQYSLASSNGTTWTTMDATNLQKTFVAPYSGTVTLTVNADLWTANAGVNQDIGIMVTGGAYPTTAGQPEVWKESGGFAGTFSPNAAAATGNIQVVEGVSYTVKVVWKSNALATGKTIYVGAGPIGGKFSPTTLRIELHGYGS